MIDAVSLFRWSAALPLVAAALAIVSAGPALAEPTAAKKDLAARVIQLQMAGIETIAQALVERPAALLLQDAGQAMQKRIAADKREAAGQRIRNSVNKYVAETAPLIRARAARLAPSVLGAELEAKFSEEELVQLVAWLESPVSRKFQQTMPAIQDSFVQKLVADSRPDVDPRLIALEQEIRSTLGLPAPPLAASQPRGRTDPAEATPKSR